MIVFQHISLCKKMVDSVLIAYCIVDALAMLGFEIGVDEVLPIY